MPKPRKKPRPSGVTVTMTKNSIRMRAHGPNAPDLRSVVPGLLGDKPKRQKPTGAIVAGADPCTCGHAPEEHGREPAYPGSTACRAEIEGEPCCDCAAYEADPEEP